MQKTSVLQLDEHCLLWTQDMSIIQGCFTQSFQLCSCYLSAVSDSWLYAWHYEDGWGIQLLNVSWFWKLQIPSNYIDSQFMHSSEKAVWYTLPDACKIFLHFRHCATVLELQDNITH